MSSNKEMNNEYRKKGELFGYPECCIKSFINNTYDSQNQGMFQGSNKEGFIPCNTCHKKVILIYNQNYKTMKYGIFCQTIAFNLL